MLIATAMGESLYRKLGFQKVSEYLFFEGGDFPLHPQDRYIRQYRKSDMESILEIDRYVTAEKRSNMLQKFLRNIWVYSPGPHIEGFFMSDLDEGMILATNEQAGSALLAFKNSLEKRKNVLPTENRAGIECLLSHGAQNISSAARMILGDKIPWKPELVFSRAGGFFG